MLGPVLEFNRMQFLQLVAGNRHAEKREVNYYVRYDQCMYRAEWRHKMREEVTYTSVR